MTAVLPKANASDIVGRFREIVSDPLNLLIERHPKAGVVEAGWVILHNGNRVPYSGQLAYYGNFSDILAINRGVHEPLEEFVFQQMLTALPQSPVMIELGSYWAHYSMWLARVRPDATNIMVEPEFTNIQAGKQNFEVNGFAGVFIQALVGNGHFSIDDYMEQSGISHLNVLHSDIQGYESEMLLGTKKTLAAHNIDYIFVSTHSQELHHSTEHILTYHGYRVEVSSDFEHDTTSYDGLVFASSPTVAPVFPEGLKVAGRNAISEMTVRDRMRSVNACFSTNFG
ncbi:hypothetical protein V1281_000325 [Nitrobacteraceae bacterium AZCC 2161]